MGRDDYCFDGGVIEQINEGQLVGDWHFVVVTAQTHRTHHRCGGVRSLEGLIHGRAQEWPVLCDDDVVERFPFHEFRVESQIAGNRPRDRVDDTGVRDEQHDGVRVVDERSKAGNVVTRHLKSPSFGEVAKRKQHGAVFEPTHGASDELNIAFRSGPRSDLDQRADLAILYRFEGAKSSGEDHQDGCAQ